MNNTIAAIEPERRRSLHEIEELFDRRYDGVAAMRRFRDKVRYHVIIYGDGTAATSAVHIIGTLVREERRLQRQRDRTEQLTRRQAP